jgi:hypothetical protein
VLGHQFFNDASLFLRKLFLLQPAEKNIFFFSVMSKFHIRADKIEGHIVGQGINPLCFPDLFNFFIKDRKRAVDDTMFFFQVFDYVHSRLAKTNNAAGKPMTAGRFLPRRKLILLNVF